MRTTLHLLTHNGAVLMDFQPALSAEQYATLLHIANEAETEDELKNRVEAWAQTVGLQASFDQHHV